MIKCTCEYCCLVQDDIDDKRMQQEYDVCHILGQEAFETFSVGDTVEYYIFHHADRICVFSPCRETDPPGHWKRLRETAERTFRATIKSKNEHSIELQTDSGTVKARAADAFAWGLHKV